MTDHSSLQKEKNNTDIVERLPPCPLCGGEKGYSLHEGATYRWWDVQCSNCGRVVDECASDRRTNLGSVLPERWKAADAVWSESAKYAEGMRAEITRLRAEADALRKDKARLDWLQTAADARKIELAKSLFGGGYEIGQWPSMRVTVKIGTLRDAIDAAIDATKGTT